MEKGDWLAKNVKKVTKVTKVTEVTVSCYRLQADRRLG